MVVFPLYRLFVWNNMGDIHEWSVSKNSKGDDVSRHLFGERRKCGTIELCALILNLTAYIAGLSVEVLVL
jgi:hypothetical protein